MEKADYFTMFGRICSRKHPSPPRTSAPLPRGEAYGVTITDSAGRSFSGGETPPLRRLEKTVRNGYRINVGLHPPMSDSVEAGGEHKPFRVTSLREANEAAKSRRLPRGRLDIGSRVMFQLLPRAEVEPAFEVRECVSTRLFPRSGIQWRHFLVPSFSRKSGIVDKG